MTSALSPVVSTKTSAGWDSPAKADTLGKHYADIFGAVVDFSTAEVSTKKLTATNEGFQKHLAHLFDSEAVAEKPVEKTTIAPAPKPVQMSLESLLPYLNTTQRTAYCTKFIDLIAKMHAKQECYADLSLDKLQINLQEKHLVLLPSDKSQTINHFVPQETLAFPIEYSCPHDAADYGINVLMATPQEGIKALQQMEMYSVGLILLAILSGGYVCPWADSMVHPETRPSLPAHLSADHRQIIEKLLIMKDPGLRLTAAELKACW